eukprot:SAG22_NODE_467_length_10171_cov_4.306295_19_plen_174_part_00
MDSRATGSGKHRNDREHVATTAAPTHPPALGVLDLATGVAAPRRQRLAVAPPLLELGQRHDLERREVGPGRRDVLALILGLRTGTGGQVSAAETTAVAPWAEKGAAMALFEARQAMGKHGERVMPMAAIGCHRHHRTMVCCTSLSSSSGIPYEMEREGHHKHWRAPRGPGRDR